MKLFKNGLFLTGFGALICTSALLIGCGSSAKKTVLPDGYKAYSGGGFTLLPFKQVVLPNGLRVYFVKDDSLPRVSLTLLVKAGLREESAPGLNALTASLLEQGTQSRSAIQIADELGQLGSNFEVNPGADFTTFSSDALKSGADALLTLFADMAMNPSFKDEEISRMKSQMRSGLIKKLDNPSAYADSEMKKIVWAGHAYSRDVSGTAENLTKLRKQDVIRHFLNYYRPNNAILAVTGNFDTSFESNVQSTFATWTAREVPVPAKQTVSSEPGLKVKLIVKKGLQQTQIRIAGAGIPRKDSRFLQLRVGNEILGGSFASRLNQKVRDDLGLTYSIYSYFMNLSDPGTFNISTFTKNESAVKTVDEAINVVKTYLETGATSDELKAGKAQLIGQYPRAIETSDKFAFNLLYLDFYGIGVEYLTHFEKNVNSLSKGEVAKALKEVVSPQEFKILVYGDESIIPQFDKYKPEVVKVK